MSLKIYALALFFFLSLPAFSQEDSIRNSNINPIAVNSVSPESYGYVVFNHDTLFVIKTNLGPTTAKERAELINKRLVQLRKENLAVADSFQIIDVELYSLLTYKDSPILSLSDRDANLEHQTRHELILEYRQILQTAFKNDIRSRSIWYWVLHVLYT
jgi:hypothetical protein